MLINMNFISNTKKIIFDLYLKRLHVYHFVEVNSYQNLVNNAQFTIINLNLCFLFRRTFLSQNLTNYDRRQKNKSSGKDRGFSPV